MSIIDKVLYCPTCGEEAQDCTCSTQERLAMARELIEDLSDLIMSACPSSSVWDDDGGLADRVDTFLFRDDGSDDGESA